MAYSMNLHLHALMRRKVVLGVGVVLLVALLVLPTRPFVSLKKGYWVMAPFWWRYEGQGGSCDLLAQSPSNPVVDAFEGFTAVICHYTQTDIPHHLEEISVYGHVENAKLTVGGIPATLYVGETMIGEDDTILLERGDNVYRITYSLPPPNSLVRFVADLQAKMFLLTVHFM